jgi:hypothetical protein
VRVVEDPPTLVAFTKPLYNLALDVGAVTATTRVRSIFELYGFSFGVEHDPDFLTLDSVELSSDLVDALDGDEPGFWSVDTEPEGPGAGFTVGVIFQSPEDPPGDDLRSIRSTQERPTTRVFEAAYGPGPQAAPGADTPLSFVDTLGDHVVPILFDLGGEHVPNNRGCTVTITQEPIVVDFIRCDVNADGRFTVSDAIKLLRVLFDGDTVPYRCEEAKNCNGDDVVNIADVVYFLSFLFSGDEAPPAPFPDCAPVEDPPPDFLGCDTFPLCE